MDNSTASDFGSYSIQKRALRDRSLQLNSLNNIKTTHITAGGLNDGKPGHENWLDLAHMANLIEWIINHPCTIPIIGISAQYVVGTDQGQLGSNRFDHNKVQHNGFTE